MWSGPVNEIPEGWRLCKNGVGTVNDVVVPNLSNKFIIASNNATGTPTTTILGVGAASTGGSTSFTPSGTLVMNKLGTLNIPAHHHFFLGDDRLYNSIPGGTLNGVNHRSRIGGPGKYFSSDVPPYEDGGSQGMRIVLGYDAGSSNDSNEDRRLYATSDNAITNTLNSDDVMNIANLEPPTGAFNGATADKAIIPPFYALAYIIYVGV